MPLPAYTHGTSSEPLLGETIGENLRRTVERARRKVEAIDSLEPLADLAERVPFVDSVGDLGLG